MADVADIADELYRLPPEEFIAERDRRAREYSKAKDRSAAAEVKRLRRPTVAAWALNQLRSVVPDELAELLDATDRLRAAQDAAIRDPTAGQELRALIRSHRQLVGRVTDAAVATLRDAGRDPAQHRAPIEATLLAVTGDEAVAEALRAGRLTTTAEALGFGDVPLDWQPPERPATPPKPSRPAAAPAEGDEKSRPQRRERADKERAAERRRAVAAAEKRERESERSLVKARSLAERATAAVDELRKRLATAEAEAAAAADDLDRCEAEHAEAVSEREKLGSD